MANYHEINIQALAIKMINGDVDSKNIIIKYYINYINNIINTHFNSYDCDKESLKNEMINILHNSINNYKINDNEYFSHFITRKIIQYYSNELRKLKNKEIYKAREIQQLAHKMIDGDIESLNRIIEFYSYHIRLLAKTKYKHTNIDEEDLVQIGLIGLWKAINLYKQNKLHHFSTYANTYINKEINVEINKRNKNLHTECIGLINNYYKNGLNDFIESTELDDLILELSDTKKKILYLYHWQNYTFKEIGIELGFTEANAHLQYKKTLEIIKEKLLSKELKQKKL